MKKSKFIRLSLLYWIPALCMLPGMITYCGFGWIAAFSDAIFLPLSKIPGIVHLLEWFVYPIEGTMLLTWVIPFHIGAFLLIFSWKKMSRLSQLFYLLFCLLPSLWILILLIPIPFAGMLQQIAFVLLGLFPVFQVSYLVNYIKWYKKEKPNLT